MAEEAENKRGFDDNLNFLWERRFVIDGDHRIAAVAKEIPMSEDTLYAYITGRRTMPTMLRVRVAEIVKDKTLLDKIFDGSSFVLEYREKGKKAAKPKELKDLTLSLVSDIGDFSESVRKSLEDEVLSDNEKSQLHKIVNKMRGQLESIADTIGK